MSGISSSTSIAIYLATIKDEAASVARAVKSDAVLARTVSGFTSTAGSLTTSAAILSNYKALEVLTGAFNMSGQIGQTAILRTLMTQTADASTSLVSRTGNTDYLHFARATSTRTSQSVSLGAAGGLSLATAGATASTLTLQNTAFSGSSQTASLPGVQWSFVLNDGSAAASVAAALDAAVAATGSTATYGVSSGGTVSASPGAPAVTTSTDSAGNTVYSLALETNSAGKVTRRADIVSVAVPAGTATTATAAQASTLTGALTGAIKAAGFDAALSGTNQLSIIDPATAGTNTLARAWGATIATATAGTLDSSGRLELGAAGAALKPGDVLTDGTTRIGTVKSVDTLGNVTLTAAVPVAIAAGDSIEVATGMAFGHVGSTITATAAAARGATVLSLGSAATGLVAGQIITSGGVSIGTVGSVDAKGNVSLLAGSTQAVAAGAALVVLPRSSSGTTAALADAANVASIVSSYQTNAFEIAQDDTSPGMSGALYYTRTMGSITSISGLMSNSRLLSVVTGALGLSSYFGSLDYDQQVSILTAKVDLKTMTSPAGIRRTAEQYLIATAATSTAGTGNTVLSLFTGGSASATDLFSLIAGVSSTSSTSTTGNPLAALY